MLHMGLIRELKIKSIRRYHIATVRMSISKKTTNSRCRRGYGENGSLLQYLEGCKLVTATVENRWRFLNKLRKEPPYDL